MTSIQAMAVEAYGPLSQLAAKSIALRDPARGEVRVRVAASAVNPADFKVLLGQMKFLHGRRFPLVVGYDFSGVIDAIGPGVADFAVGHAVFGFLPYGPFNQAGAFAEALIAKTSELALKPPGMTHEQAAAVATPGATALQALRDLGRLQTGQRVLITGISGGVGSVAVSVARRLGAHVTGVGSGAGLALAQRLGAEHVVDRKKGDVFALSGEPFDLMFDAAAAYSWRQWKPHLRPGGTYVTTLPSISFVVDKLASLVSRSRTALIMVKSRPEDLRTLAGWAESGLEVTVDRVVPLSRVAEAIGALERGGVVGRIVIDVRG
ncbi:MAG: NAD(P)-dependent alcohol dehydrogenase [Myxococcaceae bacterium]